MESEVGIFHFEFDSNIILNDNSSISKSDHEESSISEDKLDSEQYNLLYEIRKIVKKKKQFIIKFDTENLNFYANFIIKKHPIYSKILNSIAEYVKHKDQYEISFCFNNDITVDIINDGIIESRLETPISLEEFYNFCLIVQDIAMFITID